MFCNSTPSLFGTTIPIPKGNQYTRFLSSRPVSSPQLRHSVRPLHVVGYKPSQNGTTTQDAVEMFVASVDDLDDLKQQAQNGLQAERRLVPPPRAFKAVDQLVKGEAQQALQAANFALKAKDKQIESLKRALLERETQLKYTKSELLEARKDLQAKEMILQDAFEKLSRAATERQELRKQLISSEEDLQLKLEEIMSWSSSLSGLDDTLKFVDPLDEPTAQASPSSNTITPQTEEYKQDGEEVKDVLFKILQLSEQMASQAKEDEKLYLSLDEQIQ